MKYLKINTELKEYGTTTVETKNLYIAISENEDIDLILQMIYGTWYEVIAYTSEEAEIYVSQNYIKKAAIEILKS